ncbi:UDP-N-acetylmuramate--L-alanine ligase [Microlunatus sagamiharensis]|uniref:UDP-N-acetylmuramate--L-alanine ligase n=1 Tax=Microlunatus sagamiharensis TaxID=546874 RepID=A0A1H2MPG8_9ACTN|nr:UDP-N-acetylmuramate--L-alanine ligase [Microlunatus sagamiharensis]SDU94954.1 UDP-N-acetylmuramate--L-alanine ligase [Microlunatus sagamiharensis]
MALLEPTELVAPTELGGVHFIAVGGSGMNGIASMFLDLGVAVSGSDRNDSAYLRGLAARGADVHVGHRAEQLGDAQTVVASSAIREDNPELAEARRRGLRVLHRSAALGSLMLGRRGVAIAGTHGKTTTTAMVAGALVGAGLDPSYVIGGSFTGAKSGGHLGGGDVMVVEADESDGSFLQYPAQVVVVTNVDPDHLSNWGTAQAYADGFLRFASAPDVAVLVVSADDPGAVELTAAVRRHVEETGRGPEVVTFGHAADAVVRISGATYAGTGSSFRLSRGDAGGPMTLDVPGTYNVANAAAAYAVLTSLGVDDETAREQLSTYAGTNRRFQLVGTVDGVRVFDDYAHHPTEVENTLRAARTAVDSQPGGGRVVAVLQPHLYTRTRDLWRELADATSIADEAVVMDVCGDREDPIPGVTGALVADAVPAGTAHVTYEPDWDAAAPVVAGITRPGDLVVTLGCGDVTKVAPLIVDALARRSDLSVRTEGSAAPQADAPEPGEGAA